MADRRAAWRAHELEQLHRWQELTYAQRLAWLWQAKMFARRALEAAAGRRHEDG